MYLRSRCFSACANDTAGRCRARWRNTECYKAGEGGIHELVRHPFVQPARELVGKAHKLCIIELTIGKLVNALTDKCLEPRAP